ncbi:MAG: NBR1-Ig-like domain-containing protein, partial [Myxococcales bacterium]
MMRPALLALSLLVPSLASASPYRLPLEGCDQPTGCQPQPLNLCYVTAYYDHNGQDWSCRTGYTYDGHVGTDFGVGGWSHINQRLVVAGNDGQVVALNDGCDDRNNSLENCSCGGGFGNFVKLQHADGQATIYGHMGRGTIAVQLHQQVTCGQVLGKVASSGCSTGPHLHFEVVDPRYGSDDPYAGNCGGPISYWFSQGAYCALPVATGCTVLQTNDADFVTETVFDDTHFQPGATFTKTWTMRNTGSTVWTQSAGYRWVFDGQEQFGAPAATELGPGEAIQPGQDKTWSLAMRAPATPGTYRGYWRMNHAGHGLFGDRVWVQIIVDPPGNDDGAVFVSETVPDGTSFPAGATFTKTWTLRNTGTSTWSKSAGYRWAFDGGERLGAPDFVELDDGEAVGPNQMKTWSVVMRAPTSKGTFRSYWRMERAGSGRFGDRVWAEIVVVAQEGTDADSDGHASIGSGGDDCDDEDAEVFPGNPESCDGKDNDCDDAVDEDLTRSCQATCAGTQTCVDGTWGPCEAPEPEAEECNGRDDDCNGIVDDGAFCDDGYICQSGLCLP